MVELDLSGRTSMFATFFSVVLFLGDPSCVAPLACPPEVPYAYADQIQRHKESRKSRKLKISTVMFDRTLETLAAVVAEQVKGVSREEVLAALTHPELAKPLCVPEVLTWRELGERLTTPVALERGSAFLTTYRSAFDIAEQQFSVDRFSVAAVVGAEVHYGDYMGCHRVLAELQESYQKVQSPKSFDIARQRLISFFEIVTALKLDPINVRGSHVGATGFSQFMPENWAPYGADGNGDGVLDLYHPADAVASIGRYLKEHRWGRSRASQEKALWGYNKSHGYRRTVFLIRDELKKFYQARSRPVAPTAIPTAVTSAPS